MALAFILLLAVRSFLEPRPEDDSSLRPDQGNPWLLVPSLAESLIGSIVLWRSRAMSIRALRLVELIVLATNATLCGMVRFNMLGPSPAGPRRRRGSWSRSAGWPPSKGSSPSFWLTGC